MAPLRISPLTRTLQTLQRSTRTRNFNTISRIRQSARSFEPHPFEREPMKSAPADWGKQFKRVGDATLFFFPGFALVLGWPLIAEYFLDGHMV